MHKYGNWRKLPLGLLGLFGIIFSGCDEHSELHNVPMPPLISVEQLLEDYSSFLGREVVLQGRLSIDAQEDQYVVSQLEMGTSIFPMRESIELEFGTNEPDPVKMAECLSDVAIVIGEILESHAISVNTVKLKSDALIHSAGSCYQTP